MRHVVSELALLLRARYPLVQLVTHEEERAERALARLAQQEGVTYATWWSTTGLAQGDQRTEAADASSLLDAILARTDRMLVAAFDLHPYLDDPAVVRRLRDVVTHFARRGQTLVMVGPRLVVPPELDKDIAVLDLPLPSPEEIRRLLTMLLQSQGHTLDDALAERFVQGSLGLSEREIKRLYTRILLGGKGFGDGDLQTLIHEKRKMIRRSRFLEFWEAGLGIGAVGGMDNLKHWLGRRRVGFTERARQFGLPEPKGLFLLGVQGCGKSLMAKSVADLWGFPLLRLDVAAVFNTGRSEEGLREAVRVAESLAPVVLWIDELEKGFDGSGGGGQAFGNFLTWMQEKTEPVFVIATANDVRLLPPELLRKGRFDEIFFVDLPNVHERLEILEIHLRNRGRDPERFDLITVAEETDKFSGAELEQVVVEALFNAFAEERELRIEDLVDVAREVVPLAITMDDRLKELREWARPRTRPATMDRRRIDFFSEWNESEARTEA